MKKEIQVEATASAEHIKPESVIVEVFRHMKDKDIHIESVKQEGKSWEATGLVDKFGGRVQVKFSFSFCS
jgi:hypothetical protein